MNYYAGIDVSLEASSVWVVDANGKIVREGKVANKGLTNQGPLQKKPGLSDSEIRGRPIRPAMLPPGFAGAQPGLPFQTN